MLSPKKTKYRKAHKGRIHGNAKGGTILNFGSFVEGDVAWPHNGASDRGFAPGDYEAHETERPCLDPRVS